MKNYLIPQRTGFGDVMLTAYDYDYNSRGCEMAHFHAAYELVIVERGSAEFLIDGEGFVVKQGESILIQPFQAHRFVIADGSYVHCYTFSRHLVMTLDGYLTGMRATDPRFVMEPEMARMIVNALRKMFGDRATVKSVDDKWQELALKGIFYGVTSQFVHGVTLVKKNDSEDKIAMVIVRYIFENYKKDVSLADVAKNYGYNYQYLSRSFNKMFGTNFKKMLNYYRLEQAVYFLEETDMTISQIAFESGFQSIRSLNAVCLEIFGKSPKQVRVERKEKAERWKEKQQKRAEDAAERDRLAGINKAEEARRD